MRAQSLFLLISSVHLGHLQAADWYNLIKVGSFNVPMNNRTPPIFKPMWLKSGKDLISHSLKHSTLPKFPWFAWFSMLLQSSWVSSLQSGSVGWPYWKCLPDGSLKGPNSHSTKTDILYVFLTSSAWIHLILHFLPRCLWWCIKK